MALSTGIVILLIVLLFAIVVLVIVLVVLVVSGGAPKPPPTEEEETEEPETPPTASYYLVTSILGTQYYLAYAHENLVIQITRPSTTFSGADNQVLVSSTHQFYRSKMYFGPISSIPNDAPLTIYASTKPGGGYQVGIGGPCVVSTFYPFPNLTEAPTYLAGANGQACVGGGSILKFQQLVFTRV